MKFLAEVRSKEKETRIIKEAEAYEKQVTIEADIEVQKIKDSAETRLNVAE